VAGRNNVKVKDAFPSLIQQCRNIEACDYEENNDSDYNVS